MQIDGLHLNGIQKSQAVLVCMRRYCPQCGDVMILRHSSTRGEMIRTWYSCGADDCSGLWLKQVLNYAQTLEDDL